LADQNTAGAIAWSFGELPTVLVLAVVFFQWAGSESRSNRTRDRAIDRAGNAELDAYNARLRALAGRQA
jgi:cytochrome c oxidase assembly factor CtaG